MTASDFETDVLVVGGGPAGLATALTLAKHGVDVTLITKYRCTANTPRAHITNQRTVEVFRDLGIEDKVLAAATPAHLMANNVWATSFAGEEIARLLTWGNHPQRKHEYDAASASPMCNIPQHILEPILADEVRAAGGHIRFLTELTDFTQDQTGVTAAITDRQTGAAITARAQYLVGADGANSTVVDKLGLPLRGQHGLGASLNIWIEADLTKYCAHRPGVLYWMLRPGNDYWVGSGTFICVRPWTEWAVLFMYDPSEGEPDTSEAALRERLRPVIGDDEIPITIKAAGKWQINDVVAERFAEGRVFCVGDAVHRHPPANGLGSNTSIQDGYNLGWKLAYVLNGRAGEALLDTYDAERQPVGAKVVARANQSVRDMKPIAEALGFAPGQSEEDGWRRLEAIKAPGADNEINRARLAEAIALQNYQFNCHGVELGQHYRSSAIFASGEDGTAQTDDLVYTPSTRPGSRLPHAWVTVDQRRVSTHDLCPFGAYTLLTGPDGRDWIEAAHRIAADTGIPIAARMIGPGGDAEDPYFEWAGLRRIADSGCLLVRPDKHIAFRKNAIGHSAHDELQDVLMRILSRETETARRAAE